MRKCFKVCSGLKNNPLRILNPSLSVFVVAKWLHDRKYLEPSVVSMAVGRNIPRAIAEGMLNIGVQGRSFPPCSGSPETMMGQYHQYGVGICGGFIGYPDRNIG